MVMCVAPSPDDEDPKLIFSCGYGECIGGGHSGKAVEKNAHITEARKLALLTFALSPDGSGFLDLADCDGKSDSDSPTTPLLNKACRLISSTSGW